MTNFEKIKNWDINKFAEFSIKSIAAGMKLCGIEVPEKHIKEIVKDYKKWLESENEENIFK